LHGAIRDNNGMNEVGEQAGVREETAAGLNDTLARLVASLLVVRCSGHLADGQRRYPRWELDNATLQRLLGAGVGGVILLGGSAAELRLRTRQLQAWAATDLLLCADVEEGVGQRFEGASWLVPPLALGRLHGDDPGAAEELAERYGRCSGREARALGLNWVLGPVCDVNNNPANPVINVRSWGETPATAGALATAFVRGAQAEGVLCCAKHFPGHGDTASDSHLELPLLPLSRKRLEAVELPPFRAAIAAGVSSVMTAHLLLPELDRERPATLSAAVLTGLLRHDLGFGGLVVTDALVMEAITAHHGAGEAAVLALEAGADLVLMPADADAAMAAIVAAVEQGRLEREQLEASAKRRRLALASLQGNSLAPAGSVAEACPEPLGSLAEAGSRSIDASEPLGPLSNGPISADQQLALELVQRSLLHQGGRVTLPAGSPGAAPAINLIRVDTALSCPFLQPTAPALTRATAAGFRTVVLDSCSPSPWRIGPAAVSDPGAQEPGLAAPVTANGTSIATDAPLDLPRLGEGPVLLQLFVRGNPFRGSAAGREPWEAVIRQLQASGRLAGLAVYGSPYLWESLQPLLEDGIPAAWSPGQMPLAQAELLAALGLGTPAGRGNGFTD
jgi:beta-glucosidase